MAAAAAAAAAYRPLWWQPSPEIEDDMAISLAWLCRKAAAPDNHFLRKQMILGDSVVATTSCCECDCDGALRTQCLREAKFWETQISSDLLRDLLYNEVEAAGGNPDDDGNAVVVPQGRSKDGNLPTLQTCMEQLMQQLSAPPTIPEIATLWSRVVASWDYLGLAGDLNFRHRDVAAVVVEAISKAVQREIQPSLPPSTPLSTPKKDTFDFLPPLPALEQQKDGGGSLDTFLYSSPEKKALQEGRSPGSTPEKGGYSEALKNSIVKFGQNVDEHRRAEATSQVVQATMGTLLDFLLLANYECQLDRKKKESDDTRSTSNIAAALAAALAANKPPIFSSFLDRMSTPIREGKLKILESQLGRDVSSCVSGTCEYAKVDKSASRLLLQHLAQPKLHQNGQIFETLGALLGQNTFLQGGTSLRRHIVAAEMIRRMEEAIEQLEFHLYDDECFSKYLKMFFTAQNEASEYLKIYTAPTSNILHWLKSFYVRLMENARGDRSLLHNDPGMKLVHQLLTALMKDGSAKEEDKKQLGYAEALFWGDDDADSSYLSTKSFERREQPLPELSKQIMKLTPKLLLTPKLTLLPSRSVLAQTCYELVRIMLFPGIFSSFKWMFSPLTSPVPLLHAMTWCDAGDGAELLRVIEVMSLTLEDQSTCQTRKEFALKLLKIVDQTAPDARNAAIQGGNAFKVRMGWAKFTLLFDKEGREGVLQCVAWAQRLRPYDANLEAIFSDGLLQKELASIDFACVFRHVYRESKLVHFHKGLFHKLVIGNAHKCENVAAALRGLRDCTEPLTRCLHALAIVQEEHEQNNMTEIIQRGISQENWPEHFRCDRERQQIIRGRNHVFEVFEAKVVVDNRHARFFAIFQGSRAVEWVCFDINTHFFWFVNGGPPAPWTGEDDEAIIKTYIDSTKEAALNTKLLRIENLALALCVPGFLSLDPGIVDSALSCLREDGHVTARKKRLSEALRAANAKNI